MFEQARRDICFPEGAGGLFLTEAPPRWDECLDLNLPVFISHRCGPWDQLLEQLTLSGLSPNCPARVVEADGQVSSLRLEESQWAPKPKEDGWTLVLRWTHAEEGWRYRRPLGGRCYLVTRQAEQGQQMVEALKELGARAEAVPTIDFVEPDEQSSLLSAFEQLEQYHWLVFTSPNGVRHFFRQLQNSDRDHRALAQAKFACIGPSTAGTLAEAGFHCDLLPKRYVAEGLLDTFEARLGQELTGTRILIPRAQEAREILPDTLRERGAEVLVAPAYKTVHPALPEGLSLLPQHRVLFTSSSTVKNWVALTENTTQPCFCIGPVTADTARGFGLPILGVAEEHTVAGLLRKVREVDSLHTGEFVSTKGS